MYFLITHLRVVAALLVRETATRFGNKPGGYIWALLDPFAHIAFMSIIFMAIARHPALGTSFPLFFATGYIGFQFFHAMSTYLDGSVSGNRALLSYPNVAPIDTLVARYILQIGTTSLVAVCVFTAIVFLEGRRLTIQWHYVIEGALAASLIAVAIALTNNVVFARFPLYEKVFAIMRRPLLLTSGVFFRPDLIPHPFRDVLLLNPLCHTIMLFRKGFYPEYRAAGLDMNYVYTLTFSMLFGGMLIFTMSKRVLRGR